MDLIHLGGVLDHLEENMSSYHSLGFRIDILLIDRWEVIHSRMEVRVQEG